MESVRRPELQGPPPGSPGPSGAKSSYQGRSISPIQLRGDEAASVESFEEIAGIVDELKNQVFNKQGETAENALRTLKEMQLFFSELAKTGDSQASLIAEHVQNVLTFIDIEKQNRAGTEGQVRPEAEVPVEEVRSPEVHAPSLEEKARTRAAELQKRFEEGPVNDELHREVERFSNDYIYAPGLSDTVKSELAQSLMKSALQACESERRLHKNKAPSPKFYLETLPAIQEAMRLGMSRMKYDEAHTFLEGQKALLEWLQKGRDSFYHARFTQRYQFERPIPAQGMTEAERVDHERTLMEGLTPEDRAIAEPWFKEFAKFDDGIFERFRMDVDRSGPHHAIVNGKEGVVGEVEVNEEKGMKARLFAQWCRVLETSIKDVKEKDKPQWRTAMASLIFGASGDPCDKLASQVQEGLPQGQESPTFFIGSEGHPVISVDVRKGTCTLQRTRTAAIHSTTEPEAVLEQARVTTVQTVRVGDPTRVQYGVQWRRA